MTSSTHRGESSGTLLTTRRKMTPEVARARKELLAARGALEDGPRRPHATPRVPRWTSRPRSGATRSSPWPSRAAPGSCCWAGRGGCCRPRRRGSSQAGATRTTACCRTRWRRSCGDSGACSEPRCPGGARGGLRGLPPRARADEPEPPTATTSLWRTYDALVGPLGTVGARMLVERLFAADSCRKPGHG